MIGREMPMANKNLSEAYPACQEGGGMDLFVHRQNLEHYRRRLAGTTDETQRRQLLKLLAQEEANTPSALQNSGQE
jgi:hypothetical protein